MPKVYTELACSYFKLIDLQANPSGQNLLSFIKNEENLVAFLMPNIFQLLETKSESLINKKYFLQFQNQMFKQQKRESFFEHYLSIEEKTARDNFFEVIFYLLEEMEFITDIKSQTCIDAALKMVESQENEKNYEADLDKIRIKKLKESDHEKLLKYFVSYWSSNDKKYEVYKEKLLQHKNLKNHTGNENHFFKMIFLILDNKEEVFTDTFTKHLKNLENSYGDYFKDIKKLDEIMLDDLFILFRTAIKNDRKKIIDCILNNENFEALKFYIPCYKKAGENNHYAALKLLQHGYCMGENQIPEDWISEQALSEYLDSQIDVVDIDVVQMKSNFLLSTDERKFKIKSKSDVDHITMYSEYEKSLEYIAKSESLRGLLIHPVVSTYINLKSYKYQRIYEWNFFLFLFLYMLPFGLLITHHTFDNLNKTFASYALIILPILCIASTIFLTVRELLQLFWVSKTYKEYFNKANNILEILMITFSWIMLFVIFYMDIDEYLEIFSIISTVLIICSTTVLLSMLPFTSVPLYMMLLKRVASTFIKFFCFFIVILLAFSVSFCVVFRPRNVRKYSEIVTNTNINATVGNPQTTLSHEPEPDDDKEDVQKNFDTLIGSFFKTILMLSGEYTIEPFTLSATKMIIFFVFVLTSFVLFNLLIGLATDDVKELRNEAEELHINYEVNKFIDSVRTWSQLFEKFG